MLALRLTALLTVNAAAQGPAPSPTGTAATPPFPLVCTAGAAAQLPGSPSMSGLPSVNTPASPASGAASSVPYNAGNPAFAVPTNPANAPVLESVSPMSGRPGDTITLQGRRFGARPQVIFKDVPARILRSTDTSITAIIPASTTFPIIVETENGDTNTGEPFVYTLKYQDGVLYPIPVGDGRWFPHNPFWEAKPLDPVAKFLQYHWEQPLQPQGKAPETFSPIEADTRPASCANCHQPQYQDWRGALHATAASPLVRWTARDKSTQDANGCRRCHDPAAAPGIWTETERFRAPDDPKHFLQRDGVQCAVCHVRDNVRYGPPPRPGTGTAALATPPHGGFRAEAAFEDSRFCMGCHTFAPRVSPGGMVGDPFEEWRTSRFAQEGVSCQTCHMPDRRHLFRGIHDREMTLSGLTIGLEVTRDEPGRTTATATVTSTRVGHMFPTYPVPRVHVRLLCDDQPLGEDYVIGRDVDLVKLIENWDRRLAPGQSHVMRRDVPAGRQVTLRIDVIPRDRYEKDLQIQLAAAQKIPSHVFLKTVQELLDQEVSRRYRLIDLTVTVPPKGRTNQRLVQEGHEAAAPASP